MTFHTEQTQTETIQQLCAWLRTVVGPSWTVLCDHVTEERQELALFLGEKLPGTGRRNRIAEVDIILCNESGRTVGLIIEVDPNPNPKKALGAISAPLIADNYTPSNSFNPFKFHRTVIVYLTVLPEKPRSQKTEQLRLIEGVLPSRFDLEGRGIWAVHLCAAPRWPEAVQLFKQLIEPYLPHFSSCIFASVAATTSERSIQFRSTLSALLSSCFGQRHFVFPSPPHRTSKFFRNQFPALLTGLSSVAAVPGASRLGKDSRGLADCQTSLPGVRLLFFGQQ